MGSKLVNTVQHLPETVKNIGDTSSLGAVLLYMINALNPYFEFIIVVSTAIWFVLRAIDLAWTLWERWKNRGKKKGD